MKLEKIDASSDFASSEVVAHCTCPSGDGSLRWPCPMHPNANYARRMSITAVAEPAVELPRYDDIAIDHFAAVMKLKMATSRAKGRSGWDDSKQCSIESLQDMLLEHVKKGDPVDVANFCMMLWIRGGQTADKKGGVMEDLFAGTTFGQLALAKLAPTGLGFRLYQAGWLGKGTERDCMEVKGAEFRAAVRGPREGQLCILVKGTQRTAYVTAAEMEAFGAKHGIENS